MKRIVLAMALAGLAAIPAAHAQQQEREAVPPWARSEPPGGTYEGYPASRDTPPEQTAQRPDEMQPEQSPPGKLLKFNSNRGGGPEVQWEEDARRDLESRRQSR